MAYYFDRPPGFDRDPFLHLLDAILADVAIAVQLPPGLHAKACDRYEAVRTFAERVGSLLYGRILRFYPQGWMAIDTTISIRGTDDEYDLDIVAALELEPDAPPDDVLDLLYRSVVDYPTSQKVERRRHCHMPMNTFGNASISNVGSLETCMTSIGRSTREQFAS